MHEFEMIREFFLPLTMGRDEAIGLLDDAAILNVPEGYDLVMSSDTLSAGIHFLAHEDPANIAHKSIRVNLSDMAAMGAKPYSYQLNLAFPEPPDTALIKAFTDALLEDQRQFGVFCSGGDTTVSKAQLLVSITMTGLVPKGRAVKRSGAKPGDLLVVTGNIGDAAIGVKVKLGLLQLDDPSVFLSACDRPTPRTGICEAVHTYAHAAIDISDGLIADISHICNASGVGAQIDADNIPMSDAARHIVDLGLVSFEDLVTGGDDYELALAVPPEALGQFRKKAQVVGVTAHVIGEFIDGKEGVALFDQSGASMQLTRKGWTHF